MQSVDNLKLTKRNAAAPAKYGQRGLFHAQSDLPSLRGKFLNRLKYDRIPIWENKQRIKDLTFWRDLWLEGIFARSKLVS